MPPVLSTNLSDPGAVPYFVWDDPMTVSQLRERLRTASRPERLRFVGKILREARDSDVWRFVSLAELLADWEDISLHLGRRRTFWLYMLAQWRREGLIRAAPEFRRRLVRRGDETVIVDLVFDRAPQAVADKPFHGIVRIDPPEEILANKLCALLGRAEIRDLVDTWALERAGFPIEAALPSASRKDAGLTPAQLAWVLSQVQVSDEAILPGGVDPRELRE